ncbi:LysR family transcriptional regulator [Bradyrhizobium sp. CCBAU 45321]|uniref:Transcriptional regulator NodD2 n=1 Tax=Bradyrhizobium yuanmingense TaxID=108015 RepID=A0A1C3XFL3_9BRAD|nr:MULTISPECIES: transcriptional regulator NodD2 [Bradyrhizobium]MCA1544405.1 transcriptional regulator NodD2 [Bradyrhizobium sp. NBAIM32]MDA9545350.1 LysR family transcriptional regulator [Bradyrhizobium sp. CCBAU 45321]TWI19525.1 transcriptional regulator NodD2 [Bradyrhizobium yuanmingense]SCB50945.1 transcriptional regulator NodD2 [Bradyrhizobium yuanmingense]
MRFKGLDLNLLVALDALITERNLTSAARSINLSQPAMSAAVARLRTYFGDELFGMRGRELVLTSRAEGLAAPVRQALMHIELSIMARDVFDPARSSRRFRIALSDFITVVFLKNVVERVTREAPTVSFELAAPTAEHEELLRRGEVDFVILPDSLMSSAHPRAALFEERLVCVGCCTNRELQRGLTFDRYVSMGHVAVKHGGAPHAPVEQSFLIDLGPTRRIDILVQSFSMIPPLLVGTNRIGTMPLGLVRHFQKTMPLQIVELPDPFPAFTEAVQWPALHNNDPESLWIREILFEEATRMATAQEPPVTSTPEGAGSAGKFAQSVSPLP